MFTLLKEIFPLGPDEKNRTQLQPIRTLAELTGEIRIQSSRPSRIYQKISRKAVELKARGHSFTEISKILGQHKSTVFRAVQLYQTQESSSKK